MQSSAKKPVIVNFLASYCGDTVKLVNVVLIRKLCGRCLVCQENETPPRMIITRPGSLCQSLASYHNSEKNITQCLQLSKQAYQHFIQSNIWDRQYFPLYRDVKTTSFPEVKCVSHLHVSQPAF